MTPDWTVIQYLVYMLGSVLFLLGSLIGLIKYLAEKL